MTPRLKRLHSILRKNNLEGLLVSNQPNIAYLTGFLSSDSYLLLTPKQNFFITDSRFYQQARAALKGFVITLSGKPVFNTIARRALDTKIRYLGFEARDLDFAQYKLIKKLLRPINFIATNGLIEDLRKIKEPGELSKIKKAVSIASKALRFAVSVIRPGLKELEIAAELERFIRYKGARSTSFETIVASAMNSAYPHHATSERRVKKFDCVLIDIGVDYKGYKSNLTRTFFLGKIPSKIRKVREIVHKAQLQAIKRIKPGLRLCEIDKSARQYIAKHGYGGFFAHNIGHGIGLEIHEQPYISANNEELIQTGMVFTVEPAVYLPGKFGVRIEDDIVVTEKGCEVLSGNLNK